MILTPWGPSAVPIGGAGFAFPAGICSLITALTRFAIVPFYSSSADTFLNFFDLEEIQDDRCFSTEERDKDRDLVLIQVNLADRADKLGERPIDHTHTLPFRETDLRFGLLRFLRYLLQNRANLILLERDRAGSRADKACDTRCVTYNIPGLIAHDHFHQHIARKDLALHRAPLALFDLHLFLHRHNHAEDLIAHIHRGDARFEVALYLILVA